MVFSSGFNTHPVGTAQHKITLNAAVYEETPGLLQEEQLLLNCLRCIPTASPLSVCLRHRRRLLRTFLVRQVGPEIPQLPHLRLHTRRMPSTGKRNQATMTLQWRGETLVFGPLEWKKRRSDALMPCCPKRSVSAPQKSHGLHLPRHQKAIANGVSSRLHKVNQRTPPSARCPDARPARWPPSEPCVWGPPPVRHRSTVTVDR